jgi:hypothetical protein
LSVEGVKSTKKREKKNKIEKNWEELSSQTSPKIFFFPTDSYAYNQFLFFKMFVAS